MGSQDRGRADLPESFFEQDVHFADCPMEKEPDNEYAVCECKEIEREIREEFALNRRLGK